ncbi:DUF1767 domain protein [Medicago truncatula]|uniref:DUF1767 domain protein n=1 Tax=Medicago truncatula TaxID=3880 RepID=A0A072VM23_MEDTR|nr:DUF1767 domain protein [Medicago truncatula]
MASMSSKKRICFEKFLFSDLHSCGSGILPSPSELKLKFKTTLDGSFILQVDEFVNIFTPPEEQQGIPPPGIDRMLFLTMTDGVHTVNGMESSKQPLEAIQVCACAPLGLKRIYNVS